MVTRSQRLSPRHLIAVLLLPFMLVLAGCGRFSTDVKINSDNDIDMAIEMGLDSDFRSLMGFSDDVDVCSELDVDSDLPGGTKAESFTDGDITGCRITGKTSLEDFNDADSDAGLSLTHENGEYTFEFTGASQLGLSDVAAYAGDMDIKVAVTFPGEVTANKGGTVDGKTVTWTDIDELEAGISATAEDGGGIGAIVWIVIGVVALVVILAIVGLVIFLVSRSRKGKTPPPPAGGYPGAPAGAPGAAPYGAQPQAPQQQYPPQQQPQQYPPQQGGQQYPPQQHPPQQGGNQYPPQQYPPQQH